VHALRLKQQVVERQCVDRARLVQRPVGSDRAQSLEVDGLHWNFWSFGPHTRRATIARAVQSGLATAGRQYFERADAETWNAHTT
jgi:hypothetical protein